MAADPEHLANVADGAVGRARIARTRRRVRRLPPVETNSEKEVTRWVFAEVVPGIRDLGRSIREPRYFIKLCGHRSGASGTLTDSTGSSKGGSWFMALDGEPAPSHPLPPGYEVETIRNGPVTRVEIRTNDGALAAGGYEPKRPKPSSTTVLKSDPRTPPPRSRPSSVAALGGCRRSPAARQLLMPPPRAKDFVFKRRLETALVLTQPPTCPRKS